MSRISQRDGESGVTEPRSAVKNRNRRSTHPHREKPEAAAETKARGGEERRQLTEDCGVCVRGEQAPERRVYQHLEAALVEGGQVGERLQPSLHRLRQLHFANGWPTTPHHVTDQLMLRVEQQEGWLSRGAQGWGRGWHMSRNHWGSQEGRPGRTDLVYIELFYVHAVGARCCCSYDRCTQQQRGGTLSPAAGVQGPQKGHWNCDARLFTSQINK